MGKLYNVVLKFKDESGDTLFLNKTTFGNFCWHYGRASEFTKDEVEEYFNNPLVDIVEVENE